MIKKPFAKALSTLALSIFCSNANAIDMNMQYVVEQNVLQNESSSDSLNLESIQRIISGSGFLFTNVLSAGTWELELHEQLARKYKSLTYGEVSGHLGYTWQDGLAFGAPWYELETRLSHVFAGGDLYIGTKLKTVFNRNEQIGDDLTYQSGFSIENSWGGKVESEGLSFGIHGGFDYRINPILYFYNGSSVVSGYGVFASTNEVNGSFRIDSLSEEADNTWYLNSQRYSLIKTTFGLNLPLQEDLALDLAFEAEKGMIDAKRFDKSSVYTSFLFRF
jgi:hypothetical protein